MKNKDKSFNDRDMSERRLTERDEDIEMPQLPKIEDRRTSNQVEAAEI
jgi:hypothetical protein